MPEPGQSPAEYFAEDADDRRAALTAATALTTSGPHRAPWHRGDSYTDDWLTLADRAYTWLRNRTSLRAVAVVLIPGTITSEEHPVTTSINLEDTQEVPFTLGGLDAKGAPTDAPSDTWTWTLSDPDNSGAILTPSADTLSAVLAAGTPTPNISVSAVGQNTGIQGAEAVIVTASEAVTVALVPGTVTPEPPAGS